MLGSFYVLVEVVSRGAWLGFEAGSLYIAGARGNVSPSELSGHAVNGDEKLQCEGANTQRQRRSLPTLAEEHMRRWRKWTSTRAHCGFWPGCARACCGGSSVGER